MADSNAPLLIVGIIMVVLVTAGLTYFVVKAGEPPSAWQNQSNLSGASTITVRGEASRTLAPDQLTIGITVTGNGTTPAGSQADAASRMAALKSALLAAGVQESDIQTSSFYTNAVYNSSCGGCYPGPIYYGTDAVPAPQETAPSGSVSGGSSTGIAYPVPPYPKCGKCDPVGYQTVHSLTVKSGNVTSGGSLADAALSVNGTRFDYVYFSLKDSTRISLESELQGEAASAAKGKASAIAQGAGAKLGRVVSINPDSYYPYPVYAGSGVAGPARTDGSQAPPTEIFPTDTTVTSSITVTYELVQ